MQEAEKKAYLDVLSDTYVQGGIADYIEREVFLSRLATILSSIVHHGRGHTLVQKTVQQYPDFTCRAFTLLALLYGAYTYTPRVRDVLVDFVGLLGSELEERVREWTEYARTRNPSDIFYPELVTIWSGIEKLYVGHGVTSAPELPTTSFQAYYLLLARKESDPKALVCMSDEGLRTHVVSLFKDFQTMVAVTESNGSQVH